MRVAILGTGIVGTTIGTSLIQKGHQVFMGSRTMGNEKATAWADQSGPNASHGTFFDAAQFGEIVFNCTAGTGTLHALQLAGEVNLNGKILIDVANPLDFSKGFPPALTVCNTDSLGEQIQRTFPGIKVVKALNTMNCFLMVNPDLVAGDHNVFLSGNDDGAKSKVAQLLEEWFGWKPKNIIDLGDITSARGVEMLLPIWIRLYGKMQRADFNFHIVVEPEPQT